MSLTPVCRIHPMVLFSIADSYERRPENAFRSIGTLLGVYDKNAVEITNSFTVMHNETESGEVSVDLDYSHAMLAIHKSTNSQETILGWYSTSSKVTEASLLIHEYYAKECKTPVHLTVDMDFKNGHPSIKAYISSQIGVPKKTIGSMFVPIKIEVLYYQTEKVAVESMRSGLENKKRQVTLNNEIESIALSSQCIMQQLDYLIEYCDSVMNKKIHGDSKIGRSILQIIDNVPKLDKDEFEEMVNSNMKDMLMVIYLTRLVKTQLKVGEKINMIKGSKQI